MTYLSPFRWGRLFRHGKPRSIDQLDKLVKSWRVFDRDLALSQEDINAVVEIINARNGSQSHSTRNLSANSSEIFRALASFPAISIHIINTIVLPGEIIALCDHLAAQVSGKYRTALSDYVINNALNLFNRLKALHQEKDAAAKTLASGNIYQGDNNVYIYLLVNAGRRPTEHDAIEIIGQLLNKFIFSARICEKNESTLIEFLKKCGTRDGPCLMGSVDPSLQYAESIKTRATNHAALNIDATINELHFDAPHELIHLLVMEFELDEDMGIDAMKDRVLARYRDQTVGNIKITPEFLDKNLRIAFLMPPVNKVKI